MTDSKVVIRKATLDDAPLLAVLNVPIQKQHVAARPDIFKPTTPDDPGITAAFAAALQNPDDTIYILEVEDTPAGYLHARILHRPESPYTYATDLLLIDVISVNPEYQGKGYGSALMNTAFDLAKAHGIRRVTLKVWDFNDTAQQFYDRLGFQSFNHELEFDLGA